MVSVFFWRILVYWFNLVNVPSGIFRCFEVKIKCSKWLRHAAKSAEMFKILLKHNLFAFVKFVMLTLHSERSGLCNFLSCNPSFV